MNIEVHIWTTKDERSITLTSNEQKADYRDALPKVINSKDFKRAIVDYDDGHSHEFKTLDDLIAQLGKFGG